MNKNELKEGEIYKNINTIWTSDLEHILLVGKDLHNTINITNKSNTLHKNGNFTSSDCNFTETTPEEKHWLNSCIKADKFISYEEAMKTFIPEYVEAISNKHSNCEIIGTIYKTSELPKWVLGHQLDQYWKDYMFYYKPSTKEAYDAQFKTKEVVKVKPFEILNFRGKSTSKSLSNNCIFSNKNEFHLYFDKWHLDNVEINSVINEEGNIFIIGDIITPTSKDSVNKGKGFKITEFRLNKDKSMICAITDTHSPYGIGIDKIEHFIEKDEFVLPEVWWVKVTNENREILSKWRFQNSKLLGNNKLVGMIKVNNRKNITKGHNPINLPRNNDPFFGYTFGNEITFEQFKKYVLKEEEVKPKVGDRFKFNIQDGFTGIITEIIDSENPYCKFKNEDNHLHTGTVLIKNIRIIK